MPTFTGLKLAELMLQHRPELPIVLYSGYGDVADLNLANAVGVRAFLQKPLDVDHLNNVIREILVP